MIAMFHYARPKRPLIGTRRRRKGPDYEMAVEQITLPEPPVPSTEQAN